jgi:hypothetical protein
LGAGALGLAGLAIVEPIAARGLIADAVLVIKADIEPNGRIEGAVLVDAEPGQFVVKNFALWPCQNSRRARPNRRWCGRRDESTGGRKFRARWCSVRRKIFRDDHFGGQDGPGFGHFDVFLFENDLAAVVGDFSVRFSHSIWSKGLTWHR